MVKSCEYKPKSLYFDDLYQLVFIIINKCSVNFYETVKVLSYKVNGKKKIHKRSEVRVVKSHGRKGYHLFVFKTHKKYLEWPWL